MIDGVDQLALMLCDRAVCALLASRQLCLFSRVVCDDAVCNGCTKQASDRVTHVHDGRVRFAFVCVVKSLYVNGCDVCHEDGAQVAKVAKGTKNPHTLIIRPGREMGLVCRDPLGCVSLERDMLRKRVIFRLTPNVVISLTEASLFRVAVEVYVFIPAAIPAVRPPLQVLPCLSAHSFSPGSAIICPSP